MLFTWEKFGAIIGSIVKSSTCSCPCMPTGSNRSVPVYQSYRSVWCTSVVVFSLRLGLMSDAKVAKSDAADSLDCSGPFNCGY